MEVEEVGGRHWLMIGVPNNKKPTDFRQWAYFFLYLPACVFKREVKRCGQQLNSRAGPVPQGPVAVFAGSTKVPPLATLNSAR